MRTTLDLDDTVLAVARSISRDEGISLGAAVSKLAARGIRGESFTANEGFPTFTVSAEVSPITNELVNDHRDDS